MKKIMVALLGFVCLSLGALPLLAHHSFEAEFDGDKLMTFTGVLTRLEWENPHGWFYLDVKDSKGQVTNWAFEIAAPNVLRRFDEGIRQYFLNNQGKVLSVTASPAKNGSSRAAAERVKFMDGKILPMGSKRYRGDLDPEQILRDLK